MTGGADWLRHWLESGDAILLVGALIAAESVAVLMILKTRAAPIVLGLLPGLCLALALRAALVGDGAAWIGFWLTAALPAHLADLRYRWKAAART
jgi:hypothetical protein